MNYGTKTKIAFVERKAVLKKNEPKTKPRGSGEKIYIAI